VTRTRASLRQVEIGSPEFFMYSIVNRLRCMRGPSASGEF